MRKVALLIAVEDYADKKIQPVQYAAADLTSFSQSLLPLGFADADQIRRVNAEATKASIESDLRLTLRSLAKDDTFFLYYAGHGFSLGGVNYITCHDTRRNDLASTSVSLQVLYDGLRGSNCERICIFLDSCHSGMPADPSMRAIHTDLDDVELQEFFAAASHCVCFAACRTDEVSYSSSHLKHGIWTHHVLEALRGDAPAATFRTRFVTATSLQNYVTLAVPRTLRTEFGTPKVQRPWMCGGLTGDFVVADLTPILEQRQRAATKSVPKLNSVIISSVDRGRVKSLSGFKKTHRVPDYKGARTDEFIASISHSELEDDLNDTFQALKNAYGFKRLELEKRGPSDGGGVVVTPYFEYAISVELDAKDTSQVIWQRQISKISDPTKIFCDEFDEVFSGVFDTIELSGTDSIDVSAVVDRIELLDLDEISVSHDPDCTECIVRISGCKATIHVTEDGVSIRDGSVKSPVALLESAMVVQHRLTHDYAIKALISK